MPIRRVPLVTNEVYHVFNRGVAKAPIYSYQRTYQRFLTYLSYYRFQEPPVKLSHFLTFSKEIQAQHLSQLKQRQKTLVEIYCYCLMPNHFHLLLKQTAPNGISIFVRKIANGYSTYFNLVTERRGALFQGIFKAVRIEADEQLIHVSRYIHLNPYTGHITTRQGLFSYPWSSLPAYLNRTEDSFINSQTILGYFSNTSEYKNFLRDQADYLKSQQELKYLCLE